MLHDEAGGILGFVLGQFGVVPGGSEQDKLVVFQGLEALKESHSQDFGSPVFAVGDDGGQVDSNAEGRMGFSHKRMEIDCSQPSGADPSG
jgi:hypothetical protein